MRRSGLTISSVYLVCYFVHSFLLAADQAHTYKILMFGLNKMEVSTSLVSLLSSLAYL